MACFRQVRKRSFKGRALAAAVRGTLGTALAGDAEETSSICQLRARYCGSVATQKPP